MNKTISKLFDLLTLKERRQSYLLLCMILLMALLDMLGVASIMPFMAVLANPDLVVSNTYLAWLYHNMGFTDSEKFIFFLGIMVFVILVSAIIFKAFTSYVMFRFTNMLIYSLSQRLIAGYLRQPYDWFLNRHSSDLGKVILSEVGQIISGSVVPMMQIIVHGTVVITLLVLLMIVDPKLTMIVALGVGGAYTVIYLLLRGYLRSLGAERLRSNQARFQTVSEVFGGIKDVKVSGLESVFVKRFKVPALKLAKVGTAFSLVSVLPRYGLEAIVFGGMLLLILYLMAGSNGIEQALPILAVYAFAGYRLMPALQQTYNQLTNLRFTSPALDSIHKDLMLLSVDQDDSLTVLSPAPMGLFNELKLEKVSYTYPKSDQITLNEITFKVAVHSTVGLVGATGSGKTTAVDLILGLLQPQHGKLLVDGIPITPDNVRAWQRSIGYIPQHIYLADDSVSANIAFGISPEKIDHAAVEHASRIANLHEFVITEMEEGYATLVGERGVRLSGGQRQRIGIARALYHDPEVLILDEATSALDNLTEQAVMEAVHNIGHRKTIIMIAHRLSTVRECDKIFLLDHGQFMASGTYDELIDTNPRFKAMAGLT
jgi:ABC-type multidrug transport system fused ATPase/permease subunit